MLTQRELESAIRECENGNSSYQNCEKLATLYTIYDHLYSIPEYSRTTAKEESVIADYGVSDFLKAVRGKQAEIIWAIVDELMATIQVTNPRLYDGVMRKIAE